MAIEYSSGPASTSPVRSTGGATRIPALDGVRGLAIAMVLVAHTTLLTAPSPAWAAIRKLLMGGASGVDLFFVLSGFLITGILLDTREGPGYFRVFYARRVLRIFPLYYGFLIVYYLLAPSLYGHADPEGIAALARGRAFYLTYLGNVWSAVTGLAPGVGVSVGHFWSLAVEEQFYLVWPWVVLALSRRALGRLCGALVVGALVFRVVQVAAGAQYMAVFVLTPGRLDALAVGAWLALRARTRGLEGVRRPALVLAGPLVAASLAIYLAQPGLLPVSAEQTLGFTLHALLFGALIVLALSEPGIERLFAARPLRFLGRYSYGIYVLHLPLVFLLRALALEPQSAVGQLWFYPLAWGLSVCAALASWRYLEAPFMRLRERVPYAAAVDRPAGGEAHLQQQEETPGMAGTGAQGPRR